MSDSEYSLIEKLEEMKGNVENSVIALSDSARNLLVGPFHRTILGGRYGGQGYERPPRGQTLEINNKQYSVLPGEEENYNPNRNLLFAAPPTPPRVNPHKPPATPPRFNTPFGR